MKQSAEQQEQKRPAPKGMMSDFKKALIATAIPLAVLSATTAGLAIAGAWSNFGIFGFVALLGLAILASIGFAIAGKGQIASGIWAGIGIGIAVEVVSLGVTCFASLGSL